MRRARTRCTAVSALVAAVMAITAVVSPLDAQARDGWTKTRTEAYRVGDVGPLRDPVGQALTSPSCGVVTLGSLCFGRTAGDSFTVRIQDDSGRKVGGVLVIEARHRRPVSSAFCGQTGPLPVVPGDLAVHLDAPGDVRGRHWFGGPGCTEIRPLGNTTGATTLGATSGRVHVTLTDRG